MTSQVIPTGTDPSYEQTVTLDGIPYLLDFQYNQREDRWYLELSTVDGDPIYGAVKLVPEYPLFCQCVDARQPPGQFFVISSEANDDSPPGLDELDVGARCKLVYIPAADVETVLASTPVLAGAQIATVTQAVGGGPAPLVIDGLQISLPGLTTVASGSEGPIKYSCALTNIATVTVGGDPTYTYAVTLRIRGVVEQKTITGGTVIDGTGGSMMQGGTPASDGWNVVTLAISNPAQSYYLNVGTSGQVIVYPLDFIVTLSIQGGATVTLELNSIDSVEIANNTDGQGGSPISVRGIASPPQPFSGQFVQLNVGAVS